MKTKTSIPKKEQKMISRSLLTSLMMVIVLILSGLNVSAQQSFILNLQGQTLSFKEVNRTILVNTGNAGKNQGSIHKYANVITKDGITVYAKMTIKEVQSAFITLFDDDAITGEINRFQPRISTTSNSSGGFIVYELEFFNTANNASVFVYNYNLTGIDIDGNNSANREYVEVGGYTSYTLNNPTGLTVTTNNATARTRFTGISYSLNGVTFDNSAAFIANFLNANNKISFALGQTKANDERFYSVQLGVAGGVFSDPVIVNNPLPIAVDDVGTPVNSNTGGTAVNNVLTNDLFNGSAVVPSQVMISLVSPASNAGIVLNTSTGKVTVAPGTPAGDYELIYKICMVAAPSDCDIATVFVKVLAADLSVVKTASSLAPVVGSDITFTITATNNGPSLATDVTVNDVLPNGYTLVSATPSIGTWSAPNWTIGDMEDDASATLTVVATVKASGSYANTASISGTSYDPTSNNNSSTVTPVPVASADLGIVKTASSLTPAVGSNITFTLTATNNGPSAATGVKVVDALPNGYTFVSATTSTGSYTAPNWNIGNLALSGTATLNIVATVNATGTYLNSATISGAQTDPVSGNNTSSITPVPTAATDLAITKTVNNAAPAVGTNVTFTLSVVNNGPSAATGVKVVDALPAGYTYVSNTPSTGTWSGSTWTIGALANGATATLALVATVNATGPYANSATVSGSQTDPTPGNNTGTATTVPVGAADLSITKTVSNASPNAGTNVTFTLTAKNNGPSAATGVTVNDVLPSGYTFVSATPSAGTWTAPNWVIGNLANGATVTLSIVATVKATGNYDNTATITGNQTDPVSTNNSSTATVTPSAVADLEVTKTVNNTTPDVGSTVTFTITAKNIGPSTATGVIVNDVLPAGFSLTGATASVGTWTAPNWTIGSLALNATATLSITATVNAAGPYVNTATITGQQPDPNTANNSSQATCVPVAKADLSITKTVNSSAPVVGTNVTFTLTAKNNGPSAATGVSVNDVLPTGYTFVSATPSAGTWTAPNWTIGNLANGATVTLNIVATVLATGSYANTATISGTTSDPNPANNSSTVTPGPAASADVAIVKSVNNSNPSVGTNVIFTLTATNNGPSNAANVVVNDVLPSGYTFVNANTTSGSWAAPNWTIGTLNNGDTKTLTIEAKVKASGSYTNTATITTTTNDPNTGNNTSSVTPGPSAAADLSVTKTVSNETPTVGTNVTFTITATNNGPSAATNVKVNDILPAGYTFVSFSPVTSNWTAPNWTIGNLANGASATLNIVAKVNAAGPYVNTATISGTETDPNMGNNSNSVTCVPVSSADLSIVKSVDNATPTVGNNVSFTLTASNIGPSNATNVKVVDLLPAGYTFVSATQSSGTWASPNWTIGNLNSGSTATLIMVAKVNVTGPYANTATISGDQTDPNTDNNSSTITPGPAASADLGVLKTVDVTTPKVNDTVTFTITASNNGLSNATLVKVTDALPAGYTFVSATPSVGAWAAPVWTIGNLAKDATATLKIKAKVKANGPYANTATIEGNETDPVDENNTSTVTITPVALVGPDAINDNASTLANTPVEIIVLSNDLIGDAALNPTTVMLIATTAPNPSTVGVFTVDPVTGVVTFTPALGFTGVASIDYQVCDMNSLCDIAKITVTVIQGADILYPATGFGTLAFEDLWPGKGDYDFNDLVLDYQFKVVINAYNKVEKVTGTFIIKAFGATFENGFGFQLSNAINSSDLTVTGYELSENFISLEGNGTESGQSKPTIIVYDNAYKQMEHPGIGIGVNTTPGAPYVTPDTLVINIVLKPNTYSISDLDISNFNPFLIVNKVRSHEVHLPYYPPTDLVNPALFGQYEDNSNPSSNRYYVTDTNLPWAINIYEKFDYPQEKQEIIWAHLKFVEWATSGGVQFPDWYKNLTGYRNQSLIYQVPAQPNP